MRTENGTPPRPGTTPLAGKPTYLILPETSKQYGGPLSFSTRLKTHLERAGFREHGAIDRGLGVLIIFVKAPLASRRGGWAFPSSSG
jgi:hypothetical protein